MSMLPAVLLQKDDIPLCGSRGSTLTTTRGMMKTMAMMGAVQLTDVTALQSLGVLSRMRYKVWKNTHLL